MAHIREQGQGAVWTRPELVLEIEYRGWAEDRVLRHPSFKAIREDLTPQEFGIDLKVLRYGQPTDG